MIFLTACETGNVYTIKYINCVYNLQPTNCYKSEKKVLKCITNRHHHQKNPLSGYHLLFFVFYVLEIRIHTYNS